MERRPAGQESWILCPTFHVTREFDRIAGEACRQSVMNERTAWDVVTPDRSGRRVGEGFLREGYSSPQKRW
jgi:hypothetical protein